MIKVDLVVACSGITDRRQVSECEFWSCKDVGYGMLSSIPKPYEEVRSPASQETYWKIAFPLYSNRITKIERFTMDCIFSCQKF